MTALPAPKSAERLATVAFFGVLFVATCSIVPWELVRGAPFPDIENYIRRFDQIAEVGFTIRPGRDAWWQIYLDEPVWRVLGLFVVWSGAEYSVAISLVTAFCATVFFAYSSQRVGPILSAALLFNPMVIDLLNAQLRSALAMSILLLGLMAFRGLWARVIAVLVAAATHTSILAVGATLAGPYVLLAFKPRQVHGAVWVLLCGSVAVTAGGLVMPILLDAIGQMQYFSGTRSVAYTLFWGGLALALVFWSWVGYASPGRDYLMVILLLTLAVIGNLFGLGLIRLVPMLFPLLINSLADMGKLPRQMTAGGIGAYSLLLWYYWLAFSAPN